MHGKVVSRLACDHYPGHGVKGVILSEFWTEALRIFAIHEYIVVLIKFEYFAGITGVLSNFFKLEMSKK